MTLLEWTLIILCGILLGAYMNVSRRCMEYADLCRKFGTLNEEILENYRNSHRLAKTLSEALKNERRKNEAVPHLEFNIKETQNGLGKKEEKVAGCDPVHEESGR